MGCNEFIRLFEDLRSGTDLKNYADEEWCSNYQTDEYFLYVLCWAGWREKRQETVWKEVQNQFTAIGKNLSSYGPGDAINLSDAYPLPWQKNWLKKLVAYLTKESLNTQILVEKLRKMGYDSSRNLLQGIMETDSEKIIDCWLRDIVRLDAFPIDIRIRRLLKQYGIPADSDFIIKCCKEKSIPVREFARALYENAETLKRCK